MRFHKSYLLLGAFFNLQSTFYFEEWHAFCGVWATWPNSAFTYCYNAPWSTYAFVPALKLPGDSSEARFPLGKETRSGRGWQHHMWIHIDLWTQDTLYLRKHNESEPEDARFLWKKRGMWERSAASHINLQERCTQDAFYLRKHTESGKVSATHVLVEKRYGVRERLVAGHRHLQSQGTQDADYLRKHKESGGVGTARIFHWKTQRFLRSWREWHINLESRWRPGAFYMRKHTGFSAVGGVRTYT